MSWSATRRRRLCLCLLFLLAGSLLLTGNWLTAARQGWHQIPAWSQALALQRERAAQARLLGELDPVLPAISVPRPSLFCGSEPLIFKNGIQADPADWRNQCFAHFYGLHSVRLESP